MSNNSTFAVIYFTILGIITTAFGLSDLLVTIGGIESFGYGILEIPGDLFRGGWGGVIILFAGLFYLGGIKNINEIHQSAKIVMGSILIWIIAGCDIFALITESIPGGEEGPWLNSLSGFFETYAPPYTPAMLLLPLSLVVIYVIYQRKS